MNVGGTSVTGQAVEIATTVSSEFASDKSDGLLGLSFSSINTGTITSFYSIVYPADIFFYSDAHTSEDFL